MVDAISRLDRIGFYVAGVYPYLTQNIMQAFDTSDARLKTLALFCQDDAQVEKELEAVVSSSSAQTTEKLHLLIMSDKLNKLDLAMKLETSFHQLPFLYYLEIYNNVDMVFTIYILQHLVMLETLKIKSISFMLYAEKEEGN